MMLHTFAEYLSARIEAALADETGHWEWDQQVDGVVGFFIEVPTDPEFGRYSRPVCVVIAYLEQDDFETADGWAESGRVEPKEGDRVRFLLPTKPRKARGHREAVGTVVHISTGDRKQWTVDYGGKDSEWVTDPKAILGPAPVEEKRAPRRR